MRVAVSLNVKNEETHRLARELTDLTGESLSEAVAEAVRERLLRLKKERMKVAERLIVFGFFDDVVQGVPVAGVREPLRAAISKKLEHVDGGAHDA